LGRLSPKKPSLIFYNDTMSEKVKVKLFAQISEIAGRKELLLEGETVAEVIDELVKEVPELEDELFKEEQNELSEDIIVLKEGRNINYLNGLQSEVGKGDNISIFPVVGGG